MFKPYLVSELKVLMTIEPSTVICKTTGIPSHAEHSFMLEGLLKMDHETLEILRNQVVDVKQVKFIFVFKLNLMNNYVKLT